MPGRFEGFVGAVAAAGRDPVQAPAPRRVAGHPGVPVVADQRMQDRRARMVEQLPVLQLGGRDRQVEPRLPAL